MQRASPARDFAALLRRATRVTSPSLCPELRLRLAADLDALWCEQEQWMNCRGLAAPYWGVAWPGGQGLARFVLDEPARFAGRTVLDFGAGCGICAIAAAKAGALHVEAADIDPWAREAVVANARLNRVQVKCVAEDLIGMPARWDIVLAADIWYERFFAGRATQWLHRIARAGTTVLLADIGRAYAPRTALAELRRYLIRTSEPFEGETTGTVMVRKICSEDPPAAEL